MENKRIKRNTLRLRHQSNLSFICWRLSTLGGNRSCSTYIEQKICHNFFFFYVGYACFPLCSSLLLSFCFAFYWYPAFSLSPRFQVSFSMLLSVCSYSNNSVSIGSLDLVTLFFTPTFNKFHNVDCYPVLPNIVLGVYTSVIA